MNFKRYVESSDTWVDTPHYIHNTSTDTITTLPAVLYPNDTTATVGLKGDMSQTDTPSPDNPIQPQECGERTGNLFNINALYSTVTVDGNTFTKPQTGYNFDIYGGTSGQSEPINEAKCLYLSAGDYYLNWSYKSNNSNVSIIVKNGTEGQYSKKSEANPYSFTLDYDSYVSIRIAANSPTTLSNLMLNTGSTPLPYEPWGIKIPISSGGTTTPLYLGEVQTTRRIKKVIFDGTEDWSLENPDNFYTSNPFSDAMKSQLVLCTHQQSNGRSFDYGTNNVWISSTRKMNFRTTAIQHTLEAWKEFLASEYEAGHPMTLWYILETPTTDIVNEPLRKIGDYADTVSGITIPTITGANTLSIGTILQPSEVMVNYKGWHPVQSVHERESGAWT